MANAQLCQELQPGERVAVYDQYKQLTPLPRKYFLEKDILSKRDSSPIYNIYIPFEFTISDQVVLERYGQVTATTLSPNDRDAYTEIYQEALSLSNKELALQIKKWEMQTAIFNKVKTCYQKYKGEITDADGTIINLKILTKGQSLNWHDYPSIYNRVAIKSAPYRTNTRAWSNKISCETIIHESFHYLGLVDEYKEEELGFDCRHGAPTDSLMANQRVALKKEIKPYVLYPAHTRLITLPYCDLENERYIQCSKNAYLRQSNSCYATPEYCNGLEFLF